jgi:hypothetical protein
LCQLLGLLWVGLPSMQLFLKCNVLKLLLHPLVLHRNTLELILNLLQLFLLK